MFWIIFMTSIFLILIWKLFLEEEGNPLDALPGPRKLPVLGNVIDFIQIDASNLFLIMRKYAKEYGKRYLIKIFRRRIVHVHTPDDVETVLNHSKNITKSKPYTFMQPWLGTGLLLSSGAKWHKRRKILTPTFHFNILKNFSTVMEEKSRDLVNKLKERAGETLDVIPIISDFTLFTICETAMGTQLDSDKSSKTVEYKNAIKEIGSILLRRLLTVYLHVNFIFKRSQLGKTFEKSLVKVHSFADEVILERKKNRKEDLISIAESGEEIGSRRRQAMMDLLLEQEEKGEIDLEGIREEVHTFMFEGHDTTAMALTFGLMLLGNHQNVQDRIYEECQTILQSTDRSPTMADLSKMKYLEAVIKEILRLYPSVPFIARTITEGFYMGDLYVKKGSEVAVHIYDLHRLPELYPDPEKFIPERFLNGETRHPYAYIPFSAGPRNCIGQRFAMQEMKCALCEICRAFRLHSDSNEPPKLSADIVLRPSEPIYVKFVPR